jgi:AraC-like DNA-binding protein
LRVPQAGTTFADEFGWAESVPDLRRQPRVARRAELAASSGSGFVEHVRLSDDLYMVIGECSYRTDQSVCFVGDGLLKVHVQLEGNAIILMPDGNRMIICAGNWGMLVHPRSVEKGEWVERKQRNAFVTIYCRPQLIADFMGHGVQIEDVRSFAASAQSRCTWVSLPPEPAVYLTAREMLHCIYQQDLRLRFLEAKAVELVCRAIGAISESGVAPALTSQTSRRLKESRAILLQRWQDPPTIEQLARQVGLNRRALISGFKSQFGSTIFDFVLKHRMAHAKVLLQDRSLSIAEIAYRIGYSQPNSFAAAFKREFRCSPRDLRQ